MIDFSNTAVAFRSKSGPDLARSYWLFRLMDFPWLVHLGMKLVTIALRLHLPIEWPIKRTLFRQFCGGETLEECAATTVELGNYGIGTIPDYSVEGNGSESAFDRTAAEIVKTVDLAHGNPKIPFCVFKVTGVARFELLEKVDSAATLTPAEESEYKRARERVETLCARAHQQGVRILIDAEESWIQGAIDRLATEMMERFNRERALVFNTLQMYRSDRLDYLKEIFSAAQKQPYFLGIKLVRGAYLEKERDRASRRRVASPLLADKASTDRNYDGALALCLERIDRVSLCAGTHNEASTQLAVALMQRRRIAKNDPRVFFAQLLGMSDNLSYNLAEAGYNTAKYVPYGPVRAVLPYLFRRAAENTSIQGQTGRELMLLSTERRRRRSPQAEPMTPPGPPHPNKGLMPRT